jgi:hypothetical protein
MLNAHDGNEGLRPIALVFLVCFCLVATRGQQLRSRESTPRPQATEPASSDLIQPVELVNILKTKGDKPLILQVSSHALYTQAHIPGSEYVGPSSTAKGFGRLRKRAESLPRTQFIVLYCGCCPWSNCPNVTPAYNELRRMGFKKLKVLYIANDFSTDWVDKGYPNVKGE